MARPKTLARKLYTRILFVFVLLIIVPAGILSYFSITMIQSQFEDFERRRLEEIEKRADIFVDELVAEVRGVRDSLKESLQVYYTTETSGPEEFFPSVEEGLPLASGIFLIEKNRHVTYPTKTAPWISREELPRYEDSFPEPVGDDAEENEKLLELFRKRSLLKEMRSDARLLEMVSHDWTGAYEIYSRLANNKFAEDYAATGKAGMARTLLARGKVREAADAWAELLDEAGTTRFPGGRPVALEAYRQAADTYLKLNAYRVAAEVYLDFLGRMINGVYKLTKNEFDQALAHVMESMDDLIERKLVTDLEIDLYRNLLSQERAIRERAAFYEFLSGSFRNYIEESARGRVIGKTYYYYRQTGRGPETFVYEYLQTPGGLGVVAGFVIDVENLRTERVPALLRKYELAEACRLVPPDSDAAGKASAGGDGQRLTSTIPLPYFLPGWKLRLYNDESGIHLSNARRIMYLYLATVVALVVVICVGILLSLRGIRREIYLSRMKNDFVANVSHELKTPLTSIRMFSEMLKLGRIKNEEKRLEYSSLIFSESERLTKLINNILDFSKLEEGRKEFDFTRVDPSEAVEKTVESFRYFAESKGFELDLSIDENLPYIRADADAVEQTVMNLLSNAVKYSGDSRKVSVSVYPSEEYVAVKVRDYGIGIDGEDVPRLFEKFYRVGDHMNFKVSGSGLGLTLVHRIMQAHGGDVGVTTFPGRGSSFTLYFPVYGDSSES